MTMTYPQTEPDPAEEIVSVAARTFDRASEALNALVEELEAHNLDHGADATRLIRDLRTALNTALAERERLESRKRKDAGIVHDYAIDFDTARHEIGRRLACLRAAGDAGVVSQ